MKLANDVEIKAAAMSILKQGEVPDWINVSKFLKDQNRMALSSQKVKSIIGWALREQDKVSPVGKMKSRHVDTGVPCCEDLGLIISDPEGHVDRTKQKIDERCGPDIVSKIVDQKVQPDPSPKKTGEKDPIVQWHMESDGSFGSVKFQNMKKINSGLERIVVIIDNIGGKPNCSCGFSYKE